MALQCRVATGVRVAWGIALRSASPRPPANRRRVREAAAPGCAGVALPRGKARSVSTRGGISRVRRYGSSPGRGWQASTAGIPALATSAIGIPAAGRSSVRPVRTGSTVRRRCSVVLSRHQAGWKTCASRLPAASPLPVAPSAGSRTMPCTRAGACGNASGGPLRNARRGTVGRSAGLRDAAAAHRPARPDAARRFGDRLLECAAGAALFRACADGAPAGARDAAAGNCRPLTVRRKWSIFKTSRQYKSIRAHVESGSRHRVRVQDETGGDLSPCGFRRNDHRHEERRAARGNPPGAGLRVRMPQMPLGRSWLCRRRSWRRASGAARLSCGACRSKAGTDGGRDHRPRQQRQLAPALAGRRESRKQPVRPKGDPAGGRGQRAPCSDDMALRSRERGRHAGAQRPCVACECDELPGGTGGVADQDGHDQPHPRDGGDICAERPSWVCPFTTRPTWNSPCV